MQTKHLKILAYIRKKNIIENILLIGAIISANFASYLAYYDINALMITDATALTKYILNFTITYVIVSTSISVLLLFVQKISLLTSDEKGMISKESRIILHNAIGNKVFKFILTTIIFLFFYTGMKNSLIIISIFLAYIFLIILFDTLFNTEDTPDFVKPISDTKNQDKFTTTLMKIDFAFDVISSLKIGFASNFNFKKTLSYIYEGKYLQFLISKIGTMLVLFSLALGIARANYVQNNILVNINNNKENFVLYLSTNNGIGLYNTTLRQVSFVSWGNVKNLVFIAKNRRSLDTLTELFKKEK